MESMKQGKPALGSSHGPMASFVSCEDSDLADVARRGLERNAPCPLDATDEVLPRDLGISLAKKAEELGRGIAGLVRRWQEGKSK
jgi:hypothetical protein